MSAEPIRPPLFGEPPAETARRCSRWLGDRDCARPAVMHVLWDAETMDNGFVCSDHVRELGSVWAFVQTHALQADCAMPGALWHFDENVCRCEDSLGDPELVECTEAVAT